ncbi:MAG: hypothetical protein IK135_02050 [Bacteroidales bacterium]|nr:hypothetical protein [Bacteroidales bacterium]
MDGNNNGSFWPSYVDVMTTLFAIMLVLFAVSFSRFKIKEKELTEKVEELRDTETKLQEIVDEYDDILKIYSTVGKIDATDFFGYNKQYLKHLFQINVEYQTKEYAINKLKLDLTDVNAANKKRDSIVAAGELIRNTIIELNNSITDTEDNNIKFLVIIEGQSSRIPFNEGPWRNNYTLSYLRAQYLNAFWKENGIDLNSIPRCELIISGSGEEGVPREVPDKGRLSQLYPNSIDYQKQWHKIEERNQRFLINIVPVLGNIDSTREKIEKIKGK